MHVHFGRSQSNRRWKAAANSHLAGVWAAHVSRICASNRSRHLCRPIGLDTPKLPIAKNSFVYESHVAWSSVWRSLLRSRIFDAVLTFFIRCDANHERFADWESSRRLS